MYDWTCTKCSQKWRRIPLSGICICGGSLKDELNGLCLEDILADDYPKTQTCPSAGDVARIITQGQRYAVLKRQSWKCNMCGERLKYNKLSHFGNEIAHIDHIHPFSKRFTYPNGILKINETSNLQALCPKHNLKKSNNDVN